MQDYFFVLSVTKRQIHVTRQRPSLFLIIISSSVEISDNSTKRLDYFRFSGNPLKRFELREARIEKRENLRFSRPRLDYKLSENKQGQNHVPPRACRSPRASVCSPPPNPSRLRAPSLLQILSRAPTQSHQLLENSGAVRCARPEEK